MNLQKVTLPTYSKQEEIINATTHAFGVVLGVISGVVCVMKATQTNGVVGSLIFALSAVMLYTCSTLYHSIKKSDAKKIMRLLDHSSIFIMITGTSIALAVICVYPFNKTLAVATSVVSFLLSAFGTVLTFIDQEKYKKLQLYLYMIIGCIAVVLVYPLYKNFPDAKTIISLAAAGGVSYSVGMAFYVMGKKKKYLHSVFHVFVLAGTLLHLLALYVAV